MIIDAKIFDRPVVNELHPTMKPVGLIAECIQEGSPEGGTVYDPFLGSGTTLIASEQTNLICRDMEIDPVYVQLALDSRWEQLTGKKSIKL